MANSKTQFPFGAQVGFRPTGSEITGVHYTGTPPTLWTGFVNGPVAGFHVPVFCDRLGGLESTTIMVAISNIETVNGERLLIEAP